MLFPGTVLAGAAIALMNVLLPSLIKRRRPEHAGLLIGGYLLTLASGAVVGSLIAVPVFRAAGGGHGGAGRAGPATARPWGAPRPPPGPAGGPPAPRPTPPGGPRAGLAGRGVHGTAEPLLLRRAGLAAHPLPLPGGERRGGGQPARLDEPRQRGHRHAHPRARAPRPRPAPPGRRDGAGQRRRPQRLALRPGRRLGGLDPPARLRAGRGAGSRARLHLCPGSRSGDRRLAVRIRPVRPL